MMAPGKMPNAKPPPSNSNTNWPRVGPSNNPNQGIHNDRGSGNSAGKGGPANANCFNCNKPGHFKNECPQPRKPTPEHNRCYFCDQKGHRIGDCALWKRATPQERLAHSAKKNKETTK